MSKAKICNKRTCYGWTTPELAWKEISKRYENRHNYHNPAKKSAIQNYLKFINDYPEFGI